MIRGLAILTNETGADNNKKIGRLVEYGIDRIHVVKPMPRKKGALKGVDRFRQVKEEFDKALKLLKRGDKLVVGSLKEICQNVEEVLHVLLTVANKKVDLVSLDEGWVENSNEILREKRGVDLMTDILGFMSDPKRGTGKRQRGEVIGKGNVSQVKRVQQGQKKELKTVVEGRKTVGGGENGSGKGSNSKKQGSVGNGGGRPKGSIKMTEEKLDLAVKMYCQGDFTVKDICSIVKCNERSMYRYLQMKGVAGKRKVTTGVTEGLTAGTAANY